MFRMLGFVGWWAGIEALSVHKKLTKASDKEVKDTEYISFNAPEIQYLQVYIISIMNS
jgi:hypothetical protein